MKVKFENVELKKQREAALIITPDAQWQKLPDKRSVLCFKYHCAVYQDIEVAGAFAGQTRRGKSQAFCKKAL